MLHYCWLPSTLTGPSPAFGRKAPPSQPPPLPSQSPSPPPLPPKNRDPSHRSSDTWAARTVSDRVADGINRVAAASDSRRAAAALPQTAQAAVAATAHRPFGKQAPKVLIEPSFGNSAFEGPFQPASKRHRGDLSVSPDDGRLGTHRASSRYCCQLLQLHPVGLDQFRFNCVPLIVLDKAWVHVKRYQ